MFYGWRRRKFACELLVVLSRNSCRLLPESLLIACGIFACMCVCARVCECLCVCVCVVYEIYEALKIISGE